MILTLAGIVSFARLDINQMPDISVPIINVEVSQPGAGPVEIEKQITQRIEGALAGLGNVKSITSYMSEGSSHTSVEFQLGTPVDRAENDVRNAVANVRSSLPGGIQEPFVNRENVEGGAIAYFSVSTTDMTLEQLSWFVDNTVTKTLLSIPGIAQIQRGGGVDREIKIQLDPERLQSYGLTAAQLNDQLRQLNVDAPGGRTQIAGSEQALRVLGGAKTAQALADTRLTVSGGRTITLKDVAEVRDSFGEVRNIGRMNGRDVVSFGISKAKGASDVKVYAEVEKRLAEIKAANPKIKFELIYTSVPYTQIQYDSAIDAMIEGAILAVIVVWLFLRDWRATAISALAIPLSAIPTFFFMQLLGFTLNTISLLALSLVAGILVDDAIVEIENIVRHMRMGKSAYQASLEAADEIGLAVVATTFSIVAVFLPVSFMSGIAGQFFREFGLTVAIAVLISLLVARLITPMIAAYFLDARYALREHRTPGWVRGYLDVLGWSLRHRWLTVLGGAVAFGLMIFGLMALPMTFQPTINTDFSVANVSLPPGVQLRDLSRVTAQADAIIRKQPEVKSVYQSADNGSLDNAQLYITLVKPEDRKATSDEFEKRVAPLLEAIPDARVTFQSQRQGGGRDLTVQLVGDDVNALDRASRALLEDMRKLPQIRNPLIADDYPRPEISIKPRFDLAADLGVSVAALSETVRIATLGEIDQNTAKFTLADRQIPIRVSLKEEARRDLSTLENLPVPTANGGSVPLKVVAEIRFGEGPSVIRRYNQVRRVRIGADLAPGYETGPAQKAIYDTPTFKHLPNGITEAKTGDAQVQDEFVSGLLTAIVAGVFLVFAVLVLLYRRVLPPFVNMASLLLAPAGAVVALHLIGWPISMPVGIGILMLFGIVAKNSILLVDMAIEEQRHGARRDDAIRAAGLKRAQPIVMTTVAMVAGMVPILIGLTGDSSWRAPMAVTIIGGLTLSTILTLVLVPAGYSLSDGFEEWLGPKLARLLTTHHGAPVAPTSTALPAE